MQHHANDYKLLTSGMYMYLQCYYCVNEHVHACTQENVAHWNVEEKSNTVYYMYLHYVFMQCLNELGECMCVVHANMAIGSEVRTKHHIICMYKYMYM